VSNLFVRSACVILAACGGGGGSLATPDAHTPTPDAAPVADGDLGTAVAVTLHNVPTTPATFGFVAAYQDGSNPWQVAPAPVDDVYTLPIQSSTWSFAWLCTTPSSPLTTPQVNVFGFAIADRTTLTQTVTSACTDRGSTAEVTLTVDVSNLPADATGTYFATFAGGTSAMTPGTDPTTGTFTFQVAPGKHDLIVAHNSNTVTAGSGATDVVADSAVVQRAIDVTADQTVDVDYTGAVATRSVPIAATTTDKVSVIAMLDTANGTTPKLVNDATSTFEANALATSQVLTTDLYELQVTSSTTSASMVVQSWSPTLSAQTYVEPQGLGVVAASELGAVPYPRVATTWLPYPNALYYRWQISQTRPSSTVTWIATISPAVAGASPSYQLPDFTTFAGWAGLQLTTGNVSGKVTAFTSSLGAADFPFESRPPSGTLRTEVTSNFTFAVQ
jgi:hypothetical protein